MLIEAIRQVDELRRILPNLPPPGAQLRLCVPIAPKLSALKPSELQTLQLAVNFQTVRQVVDRTPGTEHEAYTNLHKLLREGYLESE